LQETDVSSNTALIIINCIYFKGLWVKPFKKDATRRREFQLADGTKKMTDMMYIEGDFKFDQVKELEDAYVVELPYVKSSMTFTLVVPTTNENDRLKKLVAAARLYDWSKLSKKLSETQVEVLVPKFNATFKQFLNNVMKNVSPVAIL
jgi:serine protease inhibitor